MAHPYIAWPDVEELSRLMEAAQHGEVRAVDRLLATIRPPLLGFFARRLPPDTAEDLVQESLVRITGALPRILPDRADRYIMTVARNLMRTEYRRRARDIRRRASVEPAEAIASPESVDTQYHYRELALAVHRASVEVLPPPLRAVVLGLLGGQTPAEIAVSLRVSPVTVRTRLLRARALLRHELQPVLDSPAVCAPPARAATAGSVSELAHPAARRPDGPRMSARTCMHSTFGQEDARSLARRTLPPP